MQQHGRCKKCKGCSRKFGKSGKCGLWEVRKMWEGVRWSVGGMEILEGEVTGGGAACA